MATPVIIFEVPSTFWGKNKITPVSSLLFILVLSLHMKPKVKSDKTRSFLAAAVIISLSIIVVNSSSLVEDEKTYYVLLIPGILEDTNKNNT